MSAKKSVAICFRGFDALPSHVESIIGTSASESGVKGEPVKPSVATLLRRSYFRFSVDLEEAMRLDEAIPLLFSKIGGLEKAVLVKEKIAPEFIEIGLTLPVKGSESQDGGFITLESISQLNTLGAKLTFQFI